MEYEKSNFCELCYGKTGETIAFTCGHDLCFNCLPHLIIFNAKLRGNNSMISQNLPEEYDCICCSIGKTKISFEKIKGLIKNLSIKPQGETSQTACSCGNQNSERFCLTCEKIFCDICLINHKFHQSILIHEIGCEPAYLLTGLKKNMEFYDRFHSKLNKAVSLCMEDLNLNIDKIIKLLENLKEKIKENIFEHQNNFQKQISLIENCNSFIINEINANFKILSFNKLFHLKKIQMTPPQYFSDFEIKIPDFQELKNIAISLNNPELFSEKLFEFTEIDIEAKLGKKLKYNLMSEPLKFKGEKFLNEISWECGSWVKSKKFITFERINEIFLAWLGKESTIQIFNYTKNKIETVLEGSQENNEFLDVYSSDLLYSGGSEGKFRGWDLNNFEQNLCLNVGEEILAGVVLKDIYNEINNEYLIILSFQKKTSPIKVFNFKGEILRTIVFKEQKYCPSISYFQDNIVNKTYILFGVSKMTVKLYEMKSGSILNEFKCNSHVNSLHFIKLKNYKLYDHIIYTNQTGEIYLANLKEGKIILEKKMENSIRVWDICVWDEETSIVAANDNTIKIISNNDFKILKSIKTSDSAINLIKVKDFNEEGKESLLSIQDDGIIMIYN